MRDGVSLPKSLLRLMRPKQWVKNGFLFAPLLFAGSLFDPALVLLCCAGCILFSFAASSVYILNDIVDREKDRQHPKKCQRPVASGAVSVGQAVVLLIVLLGISFSVSVYLNIWFALVLAAYVVFNLAYSFVLKHVPVVDVMSVATMYVFRIVAGAVIIGSYLLSPWIVLCTFFVSLLIAVQKRKGELASVEEGKSEGRQVLRYYRPEILRDMAVTLGAVTITAYCLYTFQSDTSGLMILTVPFVMFGLLRYQILTGTTNVGETPEEIVLKDKPMVLDLGLWVLACIGILYLV